MIRRSTWIILALFAILLAFVLYWQNRPVPSADEAIAPLESLEDEISPVFEIPDGLYVAGLRVEGSDSSLVDLQLAEQAGVWILIEPPRDDVDSERPPPRSTPPVLTATFARL